MPNTRAPWHDLMSEPPAGAHIIFWCDGSPACDAAIETFLRGGLTRNDLILIVLPKDELEDLRVRLIARGFDLDELVDRGCMLRSATEDLGLDHHEDLQKVPALRLHVHDMARSLGRSGLTIVGAVAKEFFERRQQRMAVAIEGSSGGGWLDTRTLCLYHAQSVAIDRIKDAVSLIRMHSHAVTALGGDKFFVEPVAPPIEA